MKTEIEEAITNTNEFELCEMFLKNQIELKTFKPKEVEFLKLAFEGGARVMYNVMQNRIKLGLEPKLLPSQADVSDAEISDKIKSIRIEGDLFEVNRTDREIELMTRIAKWMRSLLSDSKWVSVEERLPEIAVIVNLTLKRSKQDVYSGFRAKGGWYAFRLGEDAKQFIPNDIEQVSVTHWQPLPNPPKQ